MKENSNNLRIESVLDRLHEHAVRLAGQENAAGIQIAALIRILANQYERVFSRPDGEDELSGPRVGLLIRLFDEEQRGNQEGLTPTALSRHQNVSRNTISALLRGLEEQGLIERRLDPQDRRLFRIHLTRAGRRLATIFAPQRITCANQVIAALSPAEQAQLIALLSKLFGSLQDYCQHPNIQPAPAVEAAGQDSLTPEKM